MVACARPSSSWRATWVVAAGCLICALLFYVDVERLDDGAMVFVVGRRSLLVKSNNINNNNSSSSFASSSGTFTLAALHQRRKSQEEEGKNITHTVSGPSLPLHAVHTDDGKPAAEEDGNTHKMENVTTSNRSNSTTNTKEEVKEKKEEEAPPKPSPSKNVSLSPGGSWWEAQETAFRQRAPDFASLTSTKNIQPLRSAEAMASAQACFRHEGKYAFLLHMRKAAGTTMRAYLSEVVEEDPARHIYVTEGPTFNLSCFHDEGELLTITSLRHPIARILSSYWFEGWKQFQAPRYPPHTTKEFMAAAFNETEAKAKLPLSLGQWVEYLRQVDSLNWKRVMVGRIWSSVDNYYVGTLTNRYREDVHAPVTEKDFELAKQILASFDLVLITEWMGLSNQTLYAHHMMGYKKGGETMIHRNHNAAPSEERDESRVDPVVLAQLWEDNYYDLLLFEFAQNLVRERLEAFEEQQQRQQQQKKDRAGRGLQEKSDKKQEKEKEEEEEEEAQLQCQPPLNDKLKTISKLEKPAILEGGLQCMKFQF